MREYMGAVVVTNVVSMLRAEIGGAILLSDRSFEGKFLEGIVDSKARVVAAETMALDVLKSAKVRGVSGVAAVIADESPSEENTSHDIFSFEAGGVFSLLLASECLTKVLNHVAGRAWVIASEHLVGNLLRRCAILSNTLDELEKEFGLVLGIQREEAVDWTQFEIHLPAIAARFGVDATPVFVERVRATSELNITELMRKGNAQAIAQLLLSALHRFHPNGLHAEQHILMDEFVRSLFLSFLPIGLEKDRIFWKIRRWERLNPGYPVLPQWRELDPLQVVLDQRYWESDLKMMLEYYRDGTFAAIKLDLDNFKQVNETLGHAGGDEAIKLACRTILRVVAHQGFVYRRGGDEIVIFAPEIESEQAIQLCSDLRASIESDFAVWGAKNGLHVTPTASIGLAINSAGANLEEVVEQMDGAQLRAKREGKNRVIVERCCSEAV